MKRNTLLISALGAAGLLAVWFFVLRKSQAPAEDTLAGALDSSTTTTSGAATLATTEDLTKLGSDLLNQLSAALQPAATAVKDWVKTKGADANLWTNTRTGQKQYLPIGHSPNVFSSLTADDLAKLSTPENEPVNPVNRAIQVRSRIPYTAAPRTIVPRATPAVIRPPRVSNPRFGRVTPA